MVSMRTVSIIIVVFSILISLGSGEVISNPDKDKLLIEVITYVMQRGHFNPKKIDDSFSENVFRNYINDIDGQHRFFLQSDINNFKRYQKEIDDQIKSSEISFFNLTFNRLISRIEQVKEFYEEILTTPYDFKTKDSISLNFKSLPYAKTLNGLKAIWRKRFKLSTLEHYSSLKEQQTYNMAEDSTYQFKSDLVLEEEARAKTKKNIKNYFDIISDIERKDWFSIYVNTITMEFDPHSNYFAPEDKEKFDQNISGKFEGIGARLQKKNQEVEITEIIVGGPVWKAKALEVGDVILKVAQKEEAPVEIGSMRLSDAVKLIKGPKGTEVYLTIKRVSGLIEDIVITRDIVELEESYAKASIILKNNKQYGFIQLPKFYIDFKDQNSRNAASDIKKEIELLKNRDVKGIILDLRNNGGGSLKTVVDITGYFIDNGPIVQVKSTGGRKDILYDEDPSVVWSGSLVVMVNEFSASASEILAAALQDYKRAVILGSKQTFGKGTVQNVIDLNRIIAANQHGDLGALKITTDKFYRINGGSTQLEGVKSDIVFPSRYNSIEIGEKDQPNPLGWDRISPANYSSWNRNIQYNYIISKSKNRIENNPLTKLIIEQGEWIKLKQNDYNYNLDYEGYIAEREMDEKYSKRFEILEDFESELSISWLPDNYEVMTSFKDLKIRRDRWVKGLKKDMYIEEAVNILYDLNQNFNQKLSLN